MELKALIALLGGVRATVFLAVAVLLLAAFGVQTVRLDHRTGERDKLQADSVLWQQANRDNVKAIADLSAANAAWADAARAGQARAEAAAQKIAQEREQHARELEEARNERGVIYATDPNAAAWGRTRVPARIADQLRK